VLGVSGHPEPNSLSVFSAIASHNGFVWVAQQRILSIEPSAKTACSACAQNAPVGYDRAHENITYGVGIYCEKEHRFVDG
jgi:hypothetical protein